jgi:hypothetical protein
MCHQMQYCDTQGRGGGLSTQSDRIRHEPAGQKYGTGTLRSAGGKQSSEEHCSAGLCFCEWVGLCSCAPCSCLSKRNRQKQLNGCRNQKFLLNRNINLARQHNTRGCCGCLLVRPWGFPGIRGLNDPNPRRKTSRQAEIAMQINFDLIRVYPKRVRVSIALRLAHQT